MFFMNDYDRELIFKVNCDDIDFYNKLFIKP